LGKIDLGNMEIMVCVMLIYFKLASLESILGNDEADIVNNCRTLECEYHIKYKLRLTDMKE